MIVAIAVIYGIVCTVAIAAFIVGARSDNSHNIGDDLPDGDCFPYMPRDE